MFNNSDYFTSRRILGLFIGLLIPFESSCLFISKQFYTLMFSPINWTLKMFNDYIWYRLILQSEKKRIKTFNYCYSLKWKRNKTSRYFAFLWIWWRTFILTYIQDSFSAYPQLLWDKRCFWVCLFMPLNWRASAINAFHGGGYFAFVVA